MYDIQFHPHVDYLMLGEGIIPLWVIGDAAELAELATLQTVCKFAILFPYIADSHDLSEFRVALPYHNVSRRIKRTLRRHRRYTNVSGQQCREKGRED